MTDEREPKPCPRCGVMCTYDGWDHVHPNGVGIGSCIEEIKAQAWKDGWACREEYTGPYLSPELAYRQRGAYEELRRMGQQPPAGA